MKLGDFVKTDDGLPGWGSPGIIIKIEELTPEQVAGGLDPQDRTVHILDADLVVYTWFIFQLEVISEAR